MQFLKIFLNWLDRIVRPIAIGQLPLFLTIAQAAFWLSGLFNPAVPQRMTLVWNLVLQGEVWRIFTFMFVAPAGNPIFAIFYFYLLYMMGNFLEQTWGTVRFCAFMYVGLLLTIVASVLVPSAPFIGSYMYATIFLAFATFNPNFTFLIMFVLPVKVKYLAWLQAAGYLWMFFEGISTGNWSVSLMILAALGNYLLYFADYLASRGLGLHRRLKWQAKVQKDRRAPKHVCVVCGITSNDDRNMDFRYCSKCAGTPAYCEKHLKDHEHIVEATSADTVDT